MAEEDANDGPDRTVIERHAGAARIALIVQSHERLIGRRLIPGGGGCEGEDGDGAAAALWSLPAVVLAHGTEADPVFFYANRAALDRFAVTGAELIAMPSRLSAEPMERAAREDLLRRVAADGFIDDYAGVRIAADGRRFVIEQATVWTLTDEAGAAQGQAATFSQWRDL